LKKKVGGCLDIKKMAKKIILEKNGIAKASDFISVGISRQEIAKLHYNGYLERICQGYYQLSDKDDFSEEQLIATTIPKGIISLESALYHYNYSDFVPRKWSVTVPRNISRKLLNSSLLPLQVYYVQDSLYDLGKTTEIFNGVILSIYDRERTICDCFKYKNRLDNEIFSKAVNMYANDNKKNLNNLSIYAKKLRVYKRVTELMEVLLNG
jgi:predicted transcriptional regulator of viral defense system